MWKLHFFMLDAGVHELWNASHVRPELIQTFFRPKKTHQNSTKFQFTVCAHLHSTAMNI
jgi:hypothetical protein